MRAKSQIAVRALAVALCLPVVSSATRSGATVRAQGAAEQERMVVFELFTPPQSGGG